MHIFLQGPKRVGKSTVIRKTLELLTADKPLRLGGFFTWNGGNEDPHIYLQPARSGMEDKVCRLASYDLVNGGLISYIQAFEQDGVQILADRADAGLIIMDELGYLERSAPVFRQAVLDILASDIPVFGVLRQGDIPWHQDIKRNPKVTILDVNEKNRDKLPRELAKRLAVTMNR